MYKKIIGHVLSFSIMKEQVNIRLVIMIKCFNSYCYIVDQFSFNTYDNFCNLSVMVFKYLYILYNVYIYYLLVLFFFSVMLFNFGYAY